MKVKSLYVQDIGEIDFVKNKRAKYLRITIKPSGKIRVTMPGNCTYAQATDFVTQKTANIKKHLEKINVKKQVFDEKSDFNIRNYKLKLLKHPKDTCEYFIQESALKFYYPDSSDLTDSHVQTGIKTALIELMRKEAKEYLPARVEEIARKYNFSYKKVFVKNLKTRWGSCSSVNNINLNLHLMRLPEHLTDYVILHELVHTKEKNHGKNFYNLLENFVKNSKQLDRELKAYSTEL